MLEARDEERPAVGASLRGADLVAFVRTERTRGCSLERVDIEQLPVMTTTERHGEFIANLLPQRLVPPSNRLEKLKGNLKGFFSIRINDQWRVIFKWVDGDAYEVRVVDYH